MDEEVINETWYYPVNCSECFNELCISEKDYELYKGWISVDTFEMVLIALNIIVFLAGIIGNLLVRKNSYRVSQQVWYRLQAMF